MQKILIKNGKVWDGQQFIYADVLTEKMQIKAVAPDLSCEKAYVFDAAGMIVSPGLVDLHMHMRGTSPRRYGMQTEMACFPFGVTAACDAGSFLGDHTTLAGCAVKTSLFAGCRIDDNCFNAEASQASESP